MSFHSYLFQWLREPELIKGEPATFGLWATIYTPNFRHKKTRSKSVSFHSYLFQWLREPDLNRRPSGYEPDELPDCSIPRLKFVDLFKVAYITTWLPIKELVAGAGFEPTTFGLWARRATRLLHPAPVYFKSIDYFILSLKLEFTVTSIPKEIGCGSRIWTDDLRVMSPTSYQTAPSRAWNL